MIVPTPAPRLAARWLWPLLAALALAAVAGERMEVVELHNRPAAEIIPVLRPLLEPGEGISGTGYRLILKASPERLAELRALAGTLDRAQKRLRFTLRRAGAGEIQREGAAARAEIRATEGEIRMKAGGHVYGTERKDREEDLITATGLEGVPVFIAAGIEFPVGTVQPWVTPGGVAAVPGIEYKRATSGFYALALVNGDRVRVDIAPQREALSPAGGGKIERQAMVTSIHGRLGEWLELGGTGESRQRQGSGILYGTREKGRQRNRLWLKVELLDSGEAR